LCSRGLPVIEPPLLLVRAGRWQSGLNRIVPDEIFFVRVLNITHVRCCIPDVGFPAAIQLLADSIAAIFVHETDSAFKECIYWLVV
jgi:hypothetical protein